MQRLLFIFIIGWISACATAQPELGDIPAANTRQLNEDLLKFDSETERLIRSAHDEAMQRAETDEQRQIVDHWQDYLLNQLRVAMQHRDPRAALLDLWGVAAQLQETLDRTEDSTRLGNARPPIRSTTETIRERIEALVKQYLPPEDYERANESIQEYAKTQPFSLSGLAGGVKDNFFSLWGKGRDTVGAIASVPLLPTRAIGGFREGVDEFGAFNITAERFTNVMEKMPAELRQEMSALLNQIADQQTTLSQLMTDLRLAAEAIQGSLDRASVLTPEIDQAIHSSSDAAVRFRETADSIQGASIETRRLVEAIQGLMPQDRGGGSGGEGGGFDPKEYEAAALAIQSGSAEVTRTVEAIKALIDRGKDGRTSETQRKEGGRPFDIREYEAAANAIGGAAERLNALLSEIRSQAATGDLETTLNALQRQVEPIREAGQSLAGGILTRILISAIILLLVLFGLIAATLLLRHRLNQNR